MTDSYKIKHSVFQWLKIIEMKKFVDDGMLLRMKITLTIWQNKNTFIARTNGGFIRISKVIPCRGDMQGSWRSSYNSENQEGGESSLEWTGWPVTYSILARTFANGFHDFNLFCYRWIVYSWQRSAVTDGGGERGCKDSTSSDPFVSCKSVQ